MAAAHDIRKGQRYQALEPIPVRFLTHWSAPFTDGGTGTLPAGAAFVISFDPPTCATAASCDAEHSKEVEQLLVPEVDRRAPKYNEFSLVIEFDTIRTKCQRSDAV